jgi:hypothetical protein
VPQAALSGVSCAAFVVGDWAWAVTTSPVTITAAVAVTPSARDIRCDRFIFPIVSPLL